MDRAGRVQPYRWLAEYYDEIFAFGGAWADAAREHVLGSTLPRVKSACDLACGTGRTALLLARRGIRAFGVDLSPAMCRVARRKVRAAGLPVRIIQADMRSFRLPQKVDLVLCEFDALNHVPRESDLPRVARAVARALSPGGWFYFDVNNSPSFRHAWPLTWFLDRPDVVLVMHGGYDARRDRAWSEVEWFIREGRRWRRERERVEEVCWTPQEICAALRAAGFKQIRSWDAMPFFKNDPIIRPGYRTVYLASLHS